MSACSTCGASLAPEAHFCAACGSPVDPPAEDHREASPSPLGPSTGDRRTATIVFADLVDFTAFGEATDPETLRGLQDRYFLAAREAIERHGGTLEKYIGDAVVAVFGVPSVREDDPIRAVRAALDIRDSVAHLIRPLDDGAGTGFAVRIGITTGEVLAGDPSAGGALVTGDAVNVAARLQQVAEPGEILLGGATLRLVRHAVDTEAGGPRHVKGRVGSVEVHRVVAVTQGAEAVARRLDGPFVGRVAELDTLAIALSDAARERSSRAVTVVGLPGVGKSRLVHVALAAARREARVVRGRCLPYGEGITWWPLVEVLHDAAGITGSDDPALVRRKLGSLVAGIEHADLVERRIASVAGVNDEPAPPQEIAWAVRRLFEHLARDRPLVIVIDDIQWAEATLFDLLEHVADRLTASPVLLLFLARPELFDSRPGWMEARPFHQLVRVEPLDGGTTGTLLAALLGDLELTSAVRDRILEAAEGNPLFLEQILAMFVDDGILVAVGDGWRLARDPGVARIPPSIGGLLAARLDRLTTAERDTIERASVVGKVFWWGAVSELTPAAEQPAVGGYLAALVRRELIRPDAAGPDASVFPADEAFRFRHLLVRDAAYARLPKASRADLHERFATWLERHGGSGADLAAIIGYHLEEVVRYRRELGGDDRSTADLAQRAGDHLGAAGMAAFERAEVPATIGLLGRSVELLPADSPRRRDGLFALNEVLYQAGRAADAEACLDELEASLTDAPDPRWELAVKLRRSDRAHFRGEPGSADALARVVDEAIDRWRDLDDPALGARAWEARGMLQIQAGSMSGEERAFEEVARLAGLAGDRRRLHRIRYKRLNRAPGGLRPVPDGISLCEGALADPTSGLSLRATTLISLGFLAGLDDRLPDARRHLSEARRLGEDLGAILPTLGADWPYAAAFVERWLGDLTLAERYLRDGLSIQRKARDHWHLAGFALFLAQVILLQPARLDPARIAEVTALMAESKAVSLGEDVEVLAVTRLVEAGVADRQGDPDGAFSLARRAAASVQGVEDLALRIECGLQVAQLAAATGRVDEALATIAEVSALARQKQSRLFERIVAEQAAALHRPGLR